MLLSSNFDTTKLSGLLVAIFTPPGFASLIVVITNWIMYPVGEKPTRYERDV